MTCCNECIFLWKEAPLDASGSDTQSGFALGINRFSGSFYYAVLLLRRH